jgi:hypothetical protein
MNPTRPVLLDFDVVTRRVDLDAASIRRAAEMLETLESPLLFDEPFRATGYSPTWYATGKLHGDGMRIARYTRVYIEITAWSNSIAEVSIRPISRRVPGWGKRRQARYFDLARRTLEHYAEVLALPAVPNPRDRAVLPARTPQRIVRPDAVTPRASRG